MSNPEIMVRNPRAIGVSLVLLSVLLLAGSFTRLGGSPSGAVFSFPYHPRLSLLSLPLVEFSSGIAGIVPTRVRSRKASCTVPFSGRQVSGNAANLTGGLISIVFVFLGIAGVLRFPR